MQDTKIHEEQKLSSPVTIKNVWKPKKRWHAPWDKIQEQPRVRYENKTSVKQQKLAEVLLRGELISLFNLWGFLWPGRTLEVTVEANMMQLLVTEANRGQNSNPCHPDSSTSALSAWTEASPGSKGQVCKHEESAVSQTAQK